MRAKKWIAVALAVAIAGTGTGLLAQAMEKRQDAVMAKTAKISEKETPSAKEEKKEEAKFPIVMADIPESKREEEIKKTEADMTAEEAAHAAVQKAREVFGELEVKKVVDLDLAQYGLDKYIIKEDDNDETEDVLAGRSEVRVYHGIILCKGDVAYGFCIDSITGETVYEMGKYTNYMEKGYGNPKHDEKLTKRIQNNEKKYLHAAKQFFEEHLQQKEQAGSPVSFELLTGCTAGDVKGIHWERTVACVVCYIDNMEYTIRLDPESAEVLGWNLVMENN